MTGAPGRPVGTAGPQISSRAWRDRLILVAIAVVVAGAALSLWWLTRRYGRSPVDFQDYYDAAVRLVATGSPYRTETLNGPWRSGTPDLYVYTPVLSLALVPLTSLGLSAATAVWLLFRLVLLGLTCALMPVPRSIKLASFAVAIVSAPVIYDLEFGNVSIIVSFLAVVCWRWLDKPIGSFAIAASLAIRPWMGVIVGWWVLRRQWRALVWVAGGLLVIVAVSLPFVGLRTWLEWVQVLRNLSSEMGVHSNHDFGSTMLRLGLPQSLAFVCLLCGYVMAVVAILLSLRRDRAISYAVTLTATLLLSPLMWDHYLTVLIVPAALGAAYGRRLFLLVPLLAWLPWPFVPFVVTAVMWLLFALPDRGPRAFSFAFRRPRNTMDRAHGTPVNSVVRRAAAAWARRSAAGRPAEAGGQQQTVTSLSGATGRASGSSGLFWPWRGATEWFGQEP